MEKKYQMKKLLLSPAFSVEQLDPWYRELLEDRAKRQGITVEAAADTVENEPPFLTDVEEKARAEGKDFLVILDRELGQTSESDYPRDNCLDADAVQKFSANQEELFWKDLDHVKECPWCATILGAAVSPDRGFFEILARVNNA